MIKINVATAISPVLAGQKNSAANNEPRLIACSSVGKMQITGPVSKALDIAVGENVQFFNNISELELAIAQRDERADIRAAAEENGIDLNTREGQEAFIKAATTWFVAKGNLKYNKKGQPLSATLRYTKDEKQQYINEHGAELIADANVRNAIIERFGNADATDEELINAITVDDVPSPTYHAAAGSKTATTSTATGTGVLLSFSDTNVWNCLKADLDDLKDKKNRIFKVLLDSPVTTTVDNGYEHIEITAYPIEFDSDVDPIVRG